MFSSPIAIHPVTPQTKENPMNRVKLFLIIIMACLLTGCATSSKITLGKAESAGALTGSIARTICQQAIAEHQEKNEWPDAARLAQLTGLSAHNRYHDQSYAVWLLDKPYYPIPTQMDSTQTFAFYGYYCAEDTSYYSYCRIYYQYGPGKLELSSSEKKASLHGLSLSIEEKLLIFFHEATSLSDLSIFGKVLGDSAEKISQISPNPTAKQLLFEFSIPLLVEFFHQSEQLPPNGDLFQAKLEEFSLQLATYIHSLDWQHPD